MNAVERTSLRRNPEQGVVILLVAVVLLFVVGAMAVLAIDFVTFYTARSEAQLAAEGAALAGARVLANSGFTSGSVDQGAAEVLARTIAAQVATSNNVGGRRLNAGEVAVTFNDTERTNPRVTVQARRSDIPTFFARIWGKTQVTVQASATAEAYNPSGAGLPPLTGPVTPVAPICVKPWLLPNIDPTLGPGNQIFDPTTGAIQNLALLGWEASTTGTRLQARCETCTSGLPTNRTPSLWKYYAGDTTASGSFPAPAISSVSCTASPGFTSYQLSVAGCVQTPIACNSSVSIDMSDYANRNEQTTDAVNCVTGSTANEGDSIDPASGPPLPFQFLAGADNPIVQAGALATGTDILVSNSLVTVPVYNSTDGVVPASPVTIIGFVELFLNPDGFGVPNTGPNTDRIRTRIINLAGCGTGATGQPILGNGGGPVPVRLITSP